MVRMGSYSDLCGSLSGKSVAIWTCDTCARLCNGIGGMESAERLSERLGRDGINVTGILHTSASCVLKKVQEKNDPDIMKDTDLILSLTCETGAHCARQAFEKDVLNPIRTIGVGYIGKERVVYLKSDDGFVPVSDLKLDEDAGFDPFV